MFYEIIIIIPFVREGKCRKVKLPRLCLWKVNALPLRVLLGKDARGKRIDFIFWTLNGMAVEQSLV